MSGPARDVDLADGTAGGTAEGPPAAGAALDATEAIEGRSAEVRGRARWTTDRFGTVASPLERLEAPAPPWVRTA